MRISPSPWQTSLQQLLQPTARQNKPLRTAILGIGNTLRSDDAAGVLVAQRLTESVLVQDLDFLLILDAGHAPENNTSTLRRFRPEVVILIDAAEMGEIPGTVRWIEIGEIDGMSASTHTLPLSMLAKYLTLELSCDLKILGIQPGSTEIGDGVSEEVMQAVVQILDAILDSLQNITSGKWQV